jgi:glutamyl-tRNA synthetase
MRNYLVRLGWAHGDEEIISETDMISWFDLPAINRAPSRFDFAKLASLNAHYMRAMNDGDLTALLIAALPHLAGGEAFAARLTDARRAQVLAAMPLLKDRAKTLPDLIAAANFIVAERPLALDAAAVSLLTPEARALLRRAAAALAEVTDWTAHATESAVKDFATRENVKLGTVAQPLRAALTGRAASPGIFDVLAILGRDESLARIADQAN